MVLKSDKFFVSCALVLFLSGLTVSVFTQSGRKKDEANTKKERPRVVLIETEKESGSLSKNPANPAPSPSPKPTPATSPTPKDEDNNDGGVLEINSFLVPIPVAVTDKNGAPVNDLQLADFELAVDGKKAEISELSRSETPVRIALLFDNSSSVTEAREFELKAAGKFFRRIVRPEKDKAALFSVSTVSRLEQPLTKNVRQLIAAVELFPPPQGATALFDGIIKASKYLQENGEDGRRVIVIVSDGVDTISDSSLEGVLKTLQETNCLVYVIKTTDFENFKRTGKRGTNANLRDLVAERRMQEITAQTGGTVYSPLDEKELDAAFNQISADLSSQYVLSYYPEEIKRGEFKQISLQVKTRQALNVRTRKGYSVGKN